MNIYNNISSGQSISNWSSPAIQSSLGIVLEYQKTDQIEKTSRLKDAKFKDLCKISQAENWQNTEAQQNAYKDYYEAEDAEFKALLTAYREYLKFSKVSKAFGKVARQSFKEIANKKFLEPEQLIKYIKCYAKLGPHYKEFVKNRTYINPFYLFDTLFLDALEAEDVNVVKFLIKTKKTDPNIPFTDRCYGQNHNPMSYACMVGNSKLVKTLLKDQRLNDPSRNGNAYLTMACDSASPETVKELMKDGRVRQNVDFPKLMGQLTDVKRYKSSNEDKNAKRVEIHQFLQAEQNKNQKIKLGSLL